jgi:hypothetical protein
MIPSVIHYCWFGNNEIPKTARKCIASWKEFLPGYEIIEWNETNFDVNISPYTAEAYKVGKYAFVSDYARYWVLNKYGGVYFDTDVELIKPLRSVLEQGGFLGREAGTGGKVAPGLGMAIEPGHIICRNVLDEYNKQFFINKDGSYNQKTIVNYTTEVLDKFGLIRDDLLQEIEGIYIYPSDYFCPMDSTTGIIRITENTFSIHHYDCSWMNHKSIRFQLHLLKNRINRLVWKIQK